MSAAPATAQKVGHVHAHVQRDEILEALRFVDLGLSGVSGIPVLSGVMLDGGGGGLRLRTFNYEVQAEQHVSAAQSSGQTLVPARTLRDMVSVLPKGCEVRLTGSAATLTIEAAGIRYTLPTLPRDEYPGVIEGGYRTLFVCDGNELQELAQVLVAAGRDDSLPVLTGVHMSADPKTRRLTVATTDRYRLAVYDSQLTARVGFPDSLLIPARFLRSVAHAFRKDKLVTFSLHGKPTDYQMLRVDSGSRCVVQRLLDGEFPKYRSLLPSTADLTTHLTIEAGVMLTAIQQAAITVSRQSPVRLHLAPDGKSTFQSGDVDRTDGATAEVPVPGIDYTGDPFVIAYNPAYLRDGFRVFDATQRVQMSAVAPNKPAVFTSESRPGFTYLVMPVRLAQ